MNAPLDSGATRAPHVLLVDDVRANLVALSSLLEPLGLPVSLASSGREALSFLLREEPAVVLLDVQMPGMDGFETARAMRSVERTRHVPVIFVTALSTDSEHRFRGYREGAVDYLTKPLDPDILRCKVAVFVELFRRGEALRARDAELAQQRSIAFRDDLLAVVSHELRTPLNAISSWAQLIAGGGLDATQTQRAVDTIVRNARLQAKLLGDVMDVSRLRHGALSLELAPRDVAALVAEAVEAFRAEAASKNVSVSLETTGDARVARVVDEARLRQVVDALLRNALRRSPNDASIDVGLALGEDVRLHVHDEGEGIAAADLPELFDAVAGRSDESPALAKSGLGLFLCKELCALFGGALLAESAGPAPGARFVARLGLRRAA